MAYSSTWVLAVLAPAAITLAPPSGNNSGETGDRAGNVHHGAFRGGRLFVGQSASSAEIDGQPHRLQSTSANGPPNGRGECRLGCDKVGKAADGRFAPHRPPDARRSGSHVDRCGPPAWSGRFSPGSPGSHPPMSCGVVRQPPPPCYGVRGPVILLVSVMPQPINLCRVVGPPQLVLYDLPNGIGV